jgi:threonyl-tRNA synthetase
MVNPYLNVCSSFQKKDEAKDVLEFIDYAYGKFEFTYESKLSTVRSWIFCEITFFSYYALCADVKGK